MTPKEALEYLKNRITRLSLNHKISNRDIAELEVKEIVMGIETHVIPTLEKALERAKKVEELLGLYQKREKYRVTVDGFLQSWELTKQIKALEEEMK